MSKSSSLKSKPALPPTRSVACRSHHIERPPVPAAKVREEELREWQKAKRERIEQQKARTAAAKPRFDPSPSKPKQLNSQKCSYGAAGALLRAAHALPNTSSTNSFAARPIQAKELNTCFEKIACRDGSGDSSQKSCQRSSSETFGTTTVDSEFLEMCLGGSDALLEHEIEQEGRDRENNIDCSNNTSLSYSSEVAQRVANDDSDCESSSSDGSDGIDLEDMFAFDPETVANLVREGTTMPKLTQHLQASYADALERRLASTSSPPKQNQGDGCDSRASSPRPEIQVGHVSRHMTPEEVTPVASPRQDIVAAGALAGHAVVEAILLAQQRSRRSAAFTHRPSSMKREHAAVKAAELYGRRSLARARRSSSMEVERLESALGSVVKTVSRRHRRSLDKAVEVLECVAATDSEPLERWADDKAEAMIDIIQGAMDEAIKRHRRSIADAVRQVSSSPATNLVGGEADPSGSCASQPHARDGMDARIQRAVSAAYSLRRSGSGEQCSSAE